MDDYDTQLGDIESAGNDDAANGANEYAEDHASIEDEDAAYEYDDDGHVEHYEGDGGDEAAEHHDGVTDRSADNESGAARGDLEPAEVSGGNEAEADANKVEDLIDYVDLETASNDGQSLAGSSASAGTGKNLNQTEEEELIDYSEAKITDNYTSAFPHSSDQPDYVAADDEDLIDYTDDKNTAANEKGGLGSSRRCRSE